MLQASGRERPAWQRTADVPIQMHERPQEKNLKHVRGLRAAEQRRAAGRRAVQQQQQRRGVEQQRANERDKLPRNSGLWSGKRQNSVARRNNNARTSGNNKLINSAPRTGRQPNVNVAKSESGRRSKTGRQKPPDQALRPGTNQPISARHEQLRQERAKLSTDQCTRLRQSFTVNRDRITRVQFTRRIGTRIPRSVRLFAVPAAVLAIFPYYRDYRYVVEEDTICIVRCV